MEANAGTHATCPSLPLLQVGLRGPDGGVAGHVVVRREHLHLGLAAVDDEYDVVDRDGRFRDVCC